MKTKRLKVRRGFQLRRSHFRQAAADVVASVAGFFERGRQTPLLVLGGKIGKHEKAIRRALVREFRKARKMRVTFARSVPRAGLVAVLERFSVSDSACRSCGESARDLAAVLSMFKNGVRQRDNGAHNTISACPACGAPQEPDPVKEAPVQVSRTPNVVAKSGSTDALFREIDAL
jgi:hypothetical protein